MKLWTEGNRLWVDPPSGWRYGFPMIWDPAETPDVISFLRQNGYPEKDIPFACQYLRMWEASEDE